MHQWQLCLCLLLSCTECSQKMHWWWAVEQLQAHPLQQHHHRLLLRRPPLLLLVCLQLLVCLPLTCTACSLLS